MSEYSIVIDMMTNITFKINSIKLYLYNENHNRSHLKALYTVR